jgi:hypothetical protein
MQNVIKKLTCKGTLRYTYGFLKLGGVFVVKLKRTFLVSSKKLLSVLNFKLNPFYSLHIYTLFLADFLLRPSVIGAEKSCQSANLFKRQD